MRRLSLSVPAPAQLRVELIGVPEGAAVDLELRLEAVMDGVLVSGTVTAPAIGECGRCLEPVRSEVEADLQELYAYPDSLVEDDEVNRLEGDLLDLEPALRDAVVLALPLTPLCRADCPGLCAVCGQHLAGLPPGHAHEQVDPRWSVLRGRFAVPPTDQES